MKFWETVDAIVPVGGVDTEFTMKATVTWVDSIGQSSLNTPFRVQARLRVVYPAKHTLTPSSRIRWDGLVWVLDGGEMLHTRRGKPSHKSVSVYRVTG